jgi:ribosomal protein S18 acetylase RimI-like enzyme
LVLVSEYKETIAMAITVRRAIPADASAIIQLNIAFQDLRATVAHVAEHIQVRSQYETPFVAEIDQQVVGLACLRLLPCLCDPIPYAELTELIVDPSARRHGVGRALVRAIEAEALVQGATTLVLMTAWKNTQAHAFYHAIGYRLYTATMQRALNDP